MNNRQLIKTYKEVNLGEVSLPVCFDHAEGNYLYDHDGNNYLDFTSGYGVTSTGWLRKEIAKHKQIEEKSMKHLWAAWRMKYIENAAMDMAVVPTAPPAIFA